MIAGCGPVGPTHALVIRAIPAEAGRGHAHAAMTSPKAVELFTGPNAIVIQAHLGP
jgi:hypothetical protein